MMKIFGIRALALLWLILATYARPQIGVDDPNALRASRLLYSPRNGPDMRTILRRLRESQQLELMNAPWAVDDQQQLWQLNNGVIDHNGRLNSMEVMDDAAYMSVPDHEENTNRNQELCHARILQKCGAPVIEGFSTNEPMPLGRKCRLRENFLRCVIKLKRRTCHKRSRQDLFLTEEHVRQLRQEILTHLWSARGCVLGMEVP